MPTEPEIPFTEPIELPEGTPTSVVLDLNPPDGKWKFVPIKVSSNYELITDLSLHQDAPPIYLIGDNPLDRPWPWEFGYLKSVNPISFDLYRLDHPVETSFEKVRSAIVPPFPNSYVDWAGDPCSKYPIGGNIIQIGDEVFKEVRKDKFGNVQFDADGNVIEDKIYKPRWLLKIPFAFKGSADVTPEDSEENMVWHYVIKDSLDKGEVERVYLYPAQAINDSLLLLGKARIAYFGGAGEYYSKNFWKNAYPCTFRPYSFQPKVLKDSKETIYGIHAVNVRYQRYFQGTKTAVEGTLPLYGVDQSLLINAESNTGEYHTAHTTTYSTNLMDCTMVGAGFTFARNESTCPPGSFIKEIVPDDGSLLLSQHSVSGDGWVKSNAEYLPYVYLNVDWQSTIRVTGWVTDIHDFRGIGSEECWIPGGWSYGHWYESPDNPGNHGYSADRYEVTHTNPPDPWGRVYVEYKVCDPGYWGVGYGNGDELSGWIPTVRRISWGWSNVGEMETRITFDSPSVDGIHWAGTPGNYRYATIVYSAFNFGGSWSNGSYQYPGTRECHNFWWPTPAVWNYGAPWVMGVRSNYDIVNSNSVTRNQTPEHTPAFTAAWDWLKSQDCADFILRNSRKLQEAGANTVSNVATGNYAWSHLDTSSHTLATGPVLFYGNLYGNAIVSAEVNEGITRPVGPDRVYAVSPFYTHTNLSDVIFPEPPAGMCYAYVLPNGKCCGVSSVGVSGYTCHKGWCYSQDFGTSWSSPIVGAGNQPDYSVTQHWLPVWRCGPEGLLVQQGHYSADGGKTWSGEWSNTLGDYLNGLFFQIGPRWFAAAVHLNEAPPQRVHEITYRNTDTDKDSPFFGEAYFKTKYPIDPAKKHLVTARWKTMYPDTVADPDGSQKIMKYEELANVFIKMDLDVFNSRIYIDNQQKRDEHNELIVGDSGRELYPPPLAPWCTEVEVTYDPTPEFSGSTEANYNDTIPYALYTYDFDNPMMGMQFLAQLPPLWVQHPNGPYATYQIGAELRPDLRGFQIESYVEDDDKNPEPAPLEAYRVPSTYTTLVYDSEDGIESCFSVQARGGKSPYTWSTTSVLPDGFSFSESGVAQGRFYFPTEFNLKTKVTDSSEPPQSAEFTVKIVVRPRAKDPDLKP